MVGGGKDREEMSRLIDADALCEKIRKIYDGYMLDEGCAPIDFENMVDDMPTAFDTEKVVEQLEEKKVKFQKEMEECIFKGLPYHDSTEGKIIGINNAIDIVKKGGVE